MSAPICTIGAFTHAPAHSTSSHEKRPSADSSNGWSAIRLRQIETSSGAPRSMHGVVPQTPMWATEPTGFSWNIV